MKKILLSLTLFLGLSMTAAAQGMSDSQVQSYIQREMKTGASQSQIVMRLMQRGVTAQQLQRVRKQMTETGGMTGSGTSGSGMGEDAAVSRLREANGAQRVNAQGAPLVTTQVMPSGSGNTEGLAESRPQVYIPDTVDNKVNGKHVFGRDIFNKKNLSFEPAMNVSTPQSYVVGPGDKVNLDIFGGSQKSQQLEVSPDGVIVVEGYGPIHIGGLSVAQANAKLREELGQRYKSSTIRMTVGQTRTVQVNVMGEVAAPGSYPLSAFATVFNAIYMAGGVNGVGTLRNIKVFRGGRLLTTVDVYDYILNGKLAGNVHLQDNDVIIVGPYECIVDVQGFVKRPMAYEMKPNETIATLLKYAGGFANKSYKSAVRVHRTAGDRYSAYQVKEFDFSQFRLADGDSVIIDSIQGRYENTVEIQGAVFHPGMYDLGANPSVRSVIENAGGLTEDAFKTRAVLHRMKEDRTRRIVSVDLDGIMAGTAADITLENEDILYIPFRREAMAQRTLTIFGEVHFPGTYEYADDMTIEDFILQAGGPTDAASTARVDVSRRIVDPSATTTDKTIAQTFSFSLQNGYVVDGKRDFTLQPYDEVFVRKSPGYQPQRNISVVGEVLFEGVYSLPTKNVRLSDAIKAAGGFTDEAYIRGARVERVLNPDELFRVEQLIRMARMQTGQGLDTTQVTRMDSIYYVGINLDKAIENPGSDYDIVLREGDRLVVPEYNGTVKINGNVMYPNTVAYSPGKPYKWYVNQAGGFGMRAKKSRTYILYQNGTVTKAKGSSKIEPGCEIIVPAKTRTTQETISQIGSLSTTMATLVTLLVSVMNLVK
jgi:protein involved in polysaccharide export with SLBB domain